VVGSFDSLLSLRRQLTGQGLGGKKSIASLGGFSYGAPQMHRFGVWVNWICPRTHRANNNKAQQEELNESE
jgi:hypothetical protein